MKYAKVVIRRMRLLGRVGYLAAGMLGIAVVALPGVTLASSPPGANQAAIRYVDAHYPGKSTSRVLKTERDTERGHRVYDVRTLAPNGTIYVVHVSQSTNQVLWSSMAEKQRFGQSSQERRPAHADRSKSPEGRTVDHHRPEHKG